MEGGGEEEQPSTQAEQVEEEPPRPPTDYGQEVIDSMPIMTSKSGSIDQRILRYFIGLSPSYLLLDVTTGITNTTTSGIETWNTGFLRLVDLLLALHLRGELELDTLNEASRACSQCWTVASSWPAGGVGDQSREKVRHVAGKLRGILDPNRRTYQGNCLCALMSCPIM